MLRQGSFHGSSSSPLYPHIGRTRTIGSLGAFGANPPSLPRSFAEPSAAKLLDTTDPPAATMVYQQYFWEITGPMATDETKRAAQEFLAAQFTEAVQIEEERLNAQAAFALAPKVWKRVAETFMAQCEAWNAITKTESLSSKETILDDLPIPCSCNPTITTAHYDSNKLQMIRS